MKKVVLFGDSLTAGFNGKTTTEDVTVEVKQDLKNMGFEMEVVNAGKRGDTTKSALERLDSDVLSQKPDYVSIFFGNDLVDHSVSIEDYIKNVEKMIEKIGTEKVVLIAPAYVDPKKQAEQRHSVDIHAYGKALMDFAKENNLSHIDLAYHMTIYPAASEFLREDGLHLSKEGNELLGNLIARNIKNAELAKQN